MPVYASCTPSSAADMATQRGKLASRTGTPATAQVPISADDPVAPEPVAPQPVDPKPVDSKLIVTPRAKGPPARRPRPAKVDKQKKVQSFVVKNVPDTLHIHFLPSRQASSSQPLQLEVVGEKRPSRTRAASQPETFSKSKKAKGTKR